VAEGEAAGDGEGVGDWLASFSRSFLIFIKTLTGGGAIRAPGELEHPARRETVIARHAGREKHNIRDVFIRKSLEITDCSAKFTNSSDPGNAL